MKSYKLQQTPYGFDIQALANYRVVPATCFRCAELYRTLIAPMFRASQPDHLYSVIQNLFDHSPTIVHIALVVNNW